MVSVKGLSKAFGARKAVDDLSFEVHAGEVFGLLGPNGAGKSTTISMIVGSVPADSGQVTIGGLKIEPKSFDAKKKIGYVPQDLALYEDLSPLNNLLFFGALQGMSERQVANSADEILKKVDLVDRKNETLHKFSGGMKRRMNIAVALLHQPDLLILDEPTVGVDPQSRNQIFETIEQLNREGKTIIYTSHYMEEVERLCTRIAIMDQGKILKTGSLAELRSDAGRRKTLKVQFGRVLSHAEKSKISVAYRHAVFTENTVEIPNLQGESIFSTMDSVFSGIEIEGFSMQSPTLESVFLELTGKAVRD